MDLVLVLVRTEGVFRGDPTRLRQILANLVSNALKFTETGEVRLSLAWSRGVLSVDVVDTGIGMDKATLAKLFSEYAQADTSTTRRFGGTGLGLAICRQLAELMGGRISVRSTPGRGSAFTVRLPFPRISKLAAAWEASDSDGAGAPIDCRILAAEDNTTNQLVLRTLLNQAGIEPYIVDNGADAVEAWRAELFDVILMDIRMPVLDGLEATKAIRAAENQTGRNRTPIIALTANAMSHEVDQYLAVGMDGHVAKPLSVEELFSELNRVLAAASL